MKKRRIAPAVNAGSMADIAFLLLIFFLVATQIANDKGISIILPAYYDGPVGKKPDRDVLSILINANNELLIEKKLSKVDEIEKRVIDFVLNIEKKKDRPLSPQKAIISIQNDKATSYEVYIDVYSKIQAAYKKMRNELSRSRFSLSFDELSYNDKKDIVKAIPMKISEAEIF